MVIYKIESSKSSKGKCIFCKEPILKREGTMRYGKYRWCYKCSLKNIDKNIGMWKKRKGFLNMTNHHSEERLNSLKIVKML